MKLHLPDNAREAFQFLALGAGALLVVRLAIAALQLAIAPDATDTLGTATAPFRIGYPLVGESTLVIERMGATPRIAIGALFMLVVGAVLAIAAAFIGAATKWGALRATVLGARVGLVLGGTWASWCLLAFPAHHVVVSDTGLVRHDSRAFIGVLALPFTEVERSNPWQEVQALSQTAHATIGQRCAEIEEVRALLPEGSVIIACAAPDDGECATVLVKQKAQAERLLDILSKRWRTKVEPT